MLLLNVESELLERIKYNQKKTVFKVKRDGYSTLQLTQQHIEQKPVIYMRIRMC